MFLEGLHFFPTFVNQTIEKMKISNFLTCASLALLVLTACGEKKQTNQIIAHKPVVVKEAPVKAMGDNSHKYSVDWQGSTYDIMVTVKADKSLPVVTEGDHKYYDNCIKVRITRKDGSVFFEREFTKSDFAAYVPETYAKNGALTGIVYDRVDGDNLRFAASVGSPDASSDEYVPLAMKISRQGTVSIAQDPELGSAPEPEEEDGV